MVRVAKKWLSPESTAQLESLRNGGGVIKRRLIPPLSR